MPSYSTFWDHFTDLGDCSFVIPAALILALVMSRSQGGTRRAMQWLVVFGACGAGVLVSKVAYEGWNLGIASLDFRGFSGHTALSALFFPVAAYVGLPGEGRARWLSAAVGGTLAVLIGVSRLELGAHTLSEVVGGLSLGAAVALAYLTAPREVARPDGAGVNAWALLVGLVVLFACMKLIGRAPTNAWTFHLTEGLHHGLSGLHRLASAVARLDAIRS